MKKCKLKKLSAENFEDYSLASLAKDRERQSKENDYLDIQDVYVKLSKEKNSSALIRKSKPR